MNKCPCDKLSVDLGCGDGYNLCQGYGAKSESPNLAELRRFISTELANGHGTLTPVSNQHRESLNFIPILHNTPAREGGVAILQLTGWSINLYADGTWIVEATDGG